MMRDEHFTDSQLNQYLDQTLPPAQRDMLKQHLEGCATCRSRLADFQRLFILLQELPEVQVGVDFVPLIMARIEKNVQPNHTVKRQSIAWWIPVGALVLTGMVLYQLVAILDRQFALGTLANVWISELTEAISILGSLCQSSMIPIDSWLTPLDQSVPLVVLFLVLIWLFLHHLLLEKRGKGIRQ
jgi:predicted anti-sigma-YlaC factor YlaD